MKIIDQGYILDAEQITGPKQVCMFLSLLPHSSGKIYASYRRGSSKDSADGNGVVAESADRGRTWQTVCGGFAATRDGVPGEIRSTELFERGDGTLGALLSWADRSRGDKLYDSSADTLLPLKVYTAESADGGRSWVNYRTVDTGGFQGAAITGRVLRVPAQGWLGFFEKYAPEKPGGPNLHAAHAWVSADGRTFDRLARVARHPEDRFFFWDQRQALCPRTGRIVSMFWTYNRQEEKDEPIHLAWGDPSSLSWTTPVPTGIRGQIAAPIPLADGRLLAFYVHRHAPGSMRLIESPDGGRSWDQDGELVVYESSAGKQRGADTRSGYGEYWDDMQTWCFGHPAAVLLDDRTVLLAHYGGKSSTSLSARWAVVEV